MSASGPAAEILHLVERVSFAPSKPTVHPSAVPSVPQTVIRYRLGSRQTRCLPFGEAALEAPHGKTVFAQEGCRFERQHAVWTTAISDDIALLGEIAQPPSQFPQWDIDRAR